MIYAKAPFDKEKKKRLDEAYNWLDTYLDRVNPWVAGDDMTIADLSIIATVSTTEVYLNCL